MSKYKKIAVEFKNMDSLKKALADFGLTWQENVVLENRFNGLGGDYINSGVHDIVITKDTLDAKYSGWFNHIGFKKDEQKIEMSIDHFDEDHQAKFIGLLKQHYSYNEVKRNAKLKGYGIVEQKDESGIIRLKLRR